MRCPSGDLDEIGAHVMERGGETLRGRRILITGGSGFFGRWMIESFCRMNTKCALGASIAVLTRNASRLTASAPFVASDPAVTLVEGDLHSLAGARTDLGRFDDVIHGATDSSDNLARAHPAALLATVQGVSDTLEFAARSGARRFLYLSSGAVYGRQPPDLLGIPEEFAGAPDPFHPASAYAESKRIGELLCASFARHSSVEVVVARGFAFVGPGLPLDRAFAAGNFLGDALRGRPIDVHGDGTTIRSFLYSGDLAWWLWVLLLRGQSGRAYNVGSEEAVTIAELARETAGLAEPPVAVRVAGVPNPDRPPERYVPSTLRARTELGLVETVGWREALRKTYDWHQESGVSDARLRSVR